MSNERPPTEDILSRHGLSADDIYANAGPQDDAPPRPINLDRDESSATPADNTPLDVSERPAIAPVEEPPSPESGHLTLPDFDRYIETESYLYERALDVYREALDSPSEKIRMSAAKDVVDIYTKRRTAAQRGPAGGDTNNTQINITVDSVRRALDAAMYGLEGGLQGHPHERQLPAEDGTFSIPPVGSSDDATDGDTR